MTSETMNGGKEKSLMYETILCSPGMNEKCRISLTLTRQKVLVFCRLIEACLLDEKKGLADEILSAISKGKIEEFKLLHEEILSKAELTDFYQKLKLL